MSNLQTILGESNNIVRRQMEETKGLVNKWEKTGLLEGLDRDFDKHGIAILLENQAKQLIQESNSTGTDSNAEQWAGVALPLVRRIFAEIAAKEFVSVQPMNLPSGLVFYLDFKYGTAQPGFETNSTRTTRKTFQANSVFGVTETAADANGGLYGAGRFGYSINEAISTINTSGSYTPAANTGSLSALSTGSGDDSWNYDSKFAAANLTQLNSGHFKKLTISLAGVTNADVNGVRAFKVSGSAAGKIAQYYPQFTTYDATNNRVSFVFSGSLGGTTAGSIVQSAPEDIYLVYQRQPGGVDGTSMDTTGKGGLTGRGDFEDQLGGADIGIPELNVEMRSEAIVAKTRKLKAVWTPEFAQDLNAYHSIDAEAELTSMLSEYVSMEIDLEILDMLIQNALTTEKWSSRIGYEYDSASDQFVLNASAAAALAYNQGTWFQTLGTKIQKVSNKIHQKTMRGGANFLVTSPDVCTILESIPGYAADTNGDKMQFAMGVSKVGAINNRFTVYKNPYMTENLILLGYRGSQFLETGAVYAPYIPLIMTPLVYDPTNFTPRKGVMTRYAKKMVRPEFYGLVYVHGLDLV